MKNIVEQFENALNCIPKEELEKIIQKIDAIGTGGHPSAIEYFNAFEQQYQKLYNQKDIHTAIQFQNKQFSFIVFDNTTINTIPSFKNHTIINTELLAEFSCVENMFINTAA